jgi:hypothetical protein
MNPQELPPPEPEVLIGLSPVPFPISSNLGLDPIVLPFLPMSVPGRFRPDDLMSQVRPMRLLAQ